jgi:sulfur carrier protein
MTIKINGETREFNESATLLEVIETLGLSDKVMAAAVNMNIVKQDQWSNARLNEGDVIELLDFVGGG